VYVRRDADAGLLVEKREGNMPIASHAHSLEDNIEIDSKDMV
jgi:hypothetical protein